MSASPIELSSSTLTSNINNTSIVGNNSTLSLSTPLTTSTPTETIADPSDSESIEYTVTVRNVGGSNYYFINGVQAPVITMKRGSTYTFNQSDYSNLNHPFAIKSDSIGTQTTTYSGIPGYSGSQTVYQPAYPSAPSDLRYYCTIHGNGMGNTITMNNPSTTTQTITTTTSTYLNLINSLSSYKNFKIYRPEFHHIHSTYSGNLSFLVTSASGAQDTILRLWKVIKPTGDQQFTENQYVNVDITNSSSLTLATGTDATKVPATNMYMLWRVLNDNMNGTNEFEYPNFSSLFPLTSEQTIQYTYPPVVGKNGSAFDFILESGEEYILEYGESSSSESGGSYQIDIGSITNIETAFATVDTVDPTGSFLGYVDIPSTLGDNQTERAYVFFNVDTNTTSNTGEKGSILMNRIRKTIPVIPGNSDDLTPKNSVNTTFTITEPYRNIPSNFKIDSGGKNFNIGDHIVICNKNSVHEHNNVDLFTTYRDAIFTN